MGQWDEVSLRTGSRVVIPHGILSQDSLWCSDIETLGFSVNGRQSEEKEDSL